MIGIWNGCFRQPKDWILEWKVICCLERLLRTKDPQSLNGSQPVSVWRVWWAQSERSLVYFTEPSSLLGSLTAGDLRWASIYLTIAPLSRILTTLSSNSKKWMFKAGFEDLLQIWRSNTNKLKHPFPSRITLELSENIKCTESVPRMGCVSHIHFFPPSQSQVCQWKEPWTRI